MEYNKHMGKKILKKNKSTKNQKELFNVKVGPTKWLRSCDWLHSNSWSRAQRLESIYNHSKFSELGDFGIRYT